MKPYLALLIFVIGLVSCQNQAEQKNDIQANNVRLIQEYFEHFNHHDWQQMAQMYVTTADFKDPSFGTGIFKQTQEETILKYTTLNQIFPDLHDEVKQIYPSGDEHVIVEFISTGTAPDSSSFELPICTIFTIENGKIAKDFTYYDNFDETEGE